MEITQEQVKEAIKTAHAQCRGECIHAAAFADCMDRVVDEAETAALIGERRGSPALAAYFEGMHVGFRLAQIVQAEESKS